MTDNTKPEALDLADWLEAVGGGPSAKRCAALLREQPARITELESQLAQRFDAADMATAAAQGFRDGVASLTAQAADSVLEDAARYRFLRDGEWRDTDLEPFIRLQLNTLWDAKIDAARKQGEKQ